MVKKDGVCIDNSNKTRHLRIHHGRLGLRTKERKNIPLKLGYSLLVNVSQKKKKKKLCRTVRIRLYTSLNIDNDPLVDLSGRGFLGLPQNGISIKTGRLSDAVGAQCQFIFERFGCV